MHDQISSPQEKSCSSFYKKDSRIISRISAFKANSLLQTELKHDRSNKMVTAHKPILTFQKRAVIHLKKSRLTTSLRRGTSAHSTTQRRKTIFGI